MTFMKVTVLQAIAEQQFRLNAITSSSVQILNNNSPVYFLNFKISLYSMESDTVALRDHTCTETAAQMKPAQKSSTVSFEDSNADCR